MDSPSTPAAPRFAFTRMYASHTSPFAILNGFALSTEVLPLRVASTALPDDDTPSIQSHYRTFFSTADVPAPVFRIGTLALAKAVCLSFSLVIGTTGSCVSSPKPESGSRRLNAGCQLDSKQVPSSLVPERVPYPGFDIVSNFRHVVSGLLAFAFLIPT